MIAKPATSFLDFQVKDMNFNTDIFSTPKPFLPKSDVSEITPYFKPITYTPPILVQTPKPVAPQPMAFTGVNTVKKTISFTVLDDTGEILPGTNAAIDGTRFYQADKNGKITASNVSPTSTIKITFQGFKNYESVVSELPLKVALEKEITQLDEAVVKNDYKKPKSNTWMWLLGAVGAFGIYKYSNTGSKVVKAKI